MLYAWIFTAAVLLSAGLAIGENLLDMRAAGRPVPAIVADVYDAATLQRQSAYQREEDRLNIVSELCDAAIVLGLFWSGAYAAVAGLSDETMFSSQLVIALHITARTLFMTPLAWYRVMVLEERYGFNRTTPKTFWIDRIRTYLLTLILTAGLTGAFGALHEVLGDWIIAGFFGVAAAGVLIGNLLGPVMLRVGNKLTPLEEGPLRERLTAMLEAHGFRVKDIKIMDASRRTGKANALFIGIGRLKTIVLYDTMKDSYTPDELCAVFAHEMTHGLNRDVARRQLLAMGVPVLMIAAAWLLVRSPGPYLAAGFAGVNYGMAYLALTAFLGLILWIPTAFLAAVSRRGEKRADEGAVREGLGLPLIRALKRLARQNYSTLTPDPLLVKLQATHPPLPERIGAILSAMTKLGQAWDPADLALPPEEKKAEADDRENGASAADAQPPETADCPSEEAEKELSEARTQ